MRRFSVNVPFVKIICPYCQKFIARPGCRGAPSLIWAAHQIPAMVLCGKCFRASKMHLRVAELVAEPQPLPNTDSGSMPASVWMKT